jgi:TonB family protein
MNGLVPQKWHEVFGKVLAKKPDDRYQTATAFVQDLEFCLGSWFGGVGTEETVAMEPETRTASMHVPPEDDAATVVMKESPALAAGAEDMPPTVVMHVEPGAADDAATVVMKPPPPPARPAAPPTARTAPPPPPSPAKRPPPAPPAGPSPDEPTVRVLPPTVRMAAPATEETITVRVPPSPPGAPKTQPALSVPAVPRAPSVEPSVATLPPLPVSAPVRGRRAGLPPGLLIGGGAGALLLGVVAAWLILRTGTTPAPDTVASPSPVVESPPPAPTPPPTTPLVAASGLIRVESTPPGAMVTVNGQSQGASPVEMAGLALGEYEVRLDLKGYEPKTQRVTLTSEAPREELKLTLVRAAPATGTADILSTPFGATVFVNGAPVGQTPILQHRLKPGTHRVEVTKDGYEPFAGSLSVEAGKKARFDAQLRAVAKAAPTPTPVADVVDTSRVYNNVPSDVDTLARRVSGASPGYPSELPKLRSGESASVIVSFVITEDGEVKDARVVESGGSKFLDEAVLQAVRKWRYSPAVKRGVKVKVRITQKQTFLAG